MIGFSIFGFSSRCRAIHFRPIAEWTGQLSHAIDGYFPPSLWQSMAIDISAFVCCFCGQSKDLSRKLLAQCRFSWGFATEGIGQRPDGSSRKANGGKFNSTAF